MMDDFFVLCCVSVQLVEHISQLFSFQVTVCMSELIAVVVRFLLRVRAASCPLDPHPPPPDFPLSLSHSFQISYLFSYDDYDCDCGILKILLPLK